MAGPDGGNVSPEYNALIAMTDDFCKALPITDMLPKMISKGVIDYQDQEEITNKPTRRDKVQLFIQSKLSGEMEIGDNDRFFKFLDVMKASPKCDFLVKKMKDWIAHYSGESNDSGSAGATCNTSYNEPRYDSLATSTMPGKELQPKKQWSKPKEKNHMPTNGSIVSSRVEKRADKVDPRDLMFTLPELKENVSGVIDKCGTARFTLHGDKAQKECDEVQLLLMTVNDSEFYAALFYMRKICIPKSLTVATCPTFYIGNFANISSALVQHDQGSAESQHVAGEAMRTFPNLKAIIAVGVCGTFGELGDVIISSKIAGFELIKYDKDCEITPRNPSPGTSYQLRNYLLRKSNWEFHCTKKKSYLLNQLYVHYKPMLSSSTLVACEEFRDKIRESVCKDALGLEMEGIGVAEEIRKIKPEIHFIVVKAGCDYADGKKSKEWQPVAAMAAADLVHFQLSKIHDDVFFTKIRGDWKTWSFWIFAIIAVFAILPYTPSFGIWMVILAAIVLAVAYKMVYN